MSEIVGVIALSHSPFWDLTLPQGQGGRAFASAVLALREQVAALRVGAVVLLGPDHFRNFFYDVMPAFCIGVESTHAFGDYGLKAGSLPTAGALARAIHAGVCRAGFDPAISYRMGVDHGLSQPYDLLFPHADVPVVPVMLNSNAPPRPSMRRCHAFGKALGAAIREVPGLQRVLLVASGGMSHWVQRMAIEDASMPADLRSYVIDGRDRVGPYSSARDRNLAERTRNGVMGKVNDVWDREILSMFVSDSLEKLFSYTDDEIEEIAGNGAHELRSWVAATAAWGAAVNVLAYEAVPSWVTGMGCITSLPIEADAGRVSNGM